MQLPCLCFEVSGGSALNAVVLAGVTTRTRSMLRSPAARKASKPAERRDKLDTLVGVYKKQFMSKPTDRPQLDRRWFD